MREFIFTIIRFFNFIGYSAAVIVPVVTISQYLIAMYPEYTNVITSMGMGIIGMAVVYFWVKFVLIPGNSPSPRPYDSE